MKAQGQIHFPSTSLFRNSVNFPSNCKTMIRSRTLIVLGLFILLGCRPTGESHQEMDTPNILILLADDLGYGDLGCYGGIAHTPNLDRLALEGIRFTDFYAAAPNCSPSRVGLLTGRSPSKVGMYNYLSDKHPMHLPGEEITIAEVVRTKAYRTGHFGKWHVSCLPQDPELNQPQPDEQGFEHSLGTANNARPTHLNPNNFIRNGDSTGILNGYSCDIVVQEAINWLDTLSPADPFLMYVAFHEPHKIVASPPDLTAKYAGYSKAEAEYFASVENMDRAAGRLLSELAKRGLEENTIILFASDNGSYRNGSNGELLGGKSFVYEGGIRVPGILRWKGRIDAGQVIHEPVGLVDVMPTICALTGAEHPNHSELDGVSWHPLLTHSSLEREKPLSWFFYRTSPEIAMRFGDYVMLGRDRDSTLHTHPLTAPDMDYIKTMDLEDFELYNLKTDMKQEHNIDYRTVDMGAQYRRQITDRLKEIQQVGPYWEDLPPALGARKLKSEWRALRPKGFSN